MRVLSLFDCNLDSVTKYLSEIKYDDLKEALVEIPDLVIYISNSGDEESRKYEKIFSKVIKKYNLENQIIFININNLSIDNPLFSKAPVLLFYKNSEVSDVVDCTLFKNQKSIVKALKERGIIND